MATEDRFFEYLVFFVEINRGWEKGWNIKKLKDNKE